MSKNKRILNKGLVIFAEGSTDKIFYKALVDYIIKQNPLKTRVDIIEIVDLHGIGNFSKKLIGIFKNRILTKNKDTKFKVICAYDTDVFDFSIKPPVNWANVKIELKGLGALKVNEIKAVRMIEDWFLIDTNGICKFLKIDTTMPKGKDGNEKMKFLFNKADKIYTKGSDCGDFIKDLDINTIYNKLQNELVPLSTYLFR